LDFVSANPSVVKSIKQRELLNVWLRLYARNQRMPHVAEYQPERLADELPDLVYYGVDASHEPPRLTIQSDGTRMSSAYGHTGKGKPLDEYVGARLAPIVMPVYHQCVQRKLPVYTIAHLDDVYGRVVAYERLLLPFSEAEAVTQLIASLKTISEDGEFEIKNLMRGHDAVPRPKLCAVIDRDLFHRRPVVSRSSRDFLRIDVGREADQQLGAGLQHRALDHRGLRQHQGECLLFVQAILVGIRQFAEGGAGAVEQRLPAELIAPGFQLVPGDAGTLVVMEVVFDAMAVEPGARLLHGVAILDAVDRDGHFVAAS
jgi:hypothetical protein